MAKKPPLTVRSISKGLKSATQLIAESSRAVVEEVMPNMSSTWFSLQSEATNTVNKALTNTASVMSRQHSLISRTKLGRNIQTGITKMAHRIGLSDYEGNQIAFELENYSQDFDDDSFDEGADGKESFENGYGTSENMKALSAMNRNIAASGLATVKSMNNMTNTLANINMESTKAIVNTVENMSIAQTNAISSGMNEVVRQIQITNNYTAAMLDFMNKNISPSNANLVDTMSIIGAKLDEISEAIKGGNSISIKEEPQETPMSRIFSDGSGFDIGTYKKAMKEAFNESNIGSTLGLLTTTLSSFKSTMKNGGVKGTALQFGPLIARSLAKGATTVAFGPNTKDALSRADDDLARIMKSVLWKMGDMVDNPDANNFQKFIGSVFGVKRTKLKGLDMTKGRKDEVIGWNGIAQTALTQVIPNYLASIEKSLSGNKEQKFYDYEAGVFKTESKLMDDMIMKLVELNNQSFAEPVSRIIDALGKEGASSREVSKLVKKLDKIINTRINEGRGKDQAYQDAIADAFKDFKIDSAMQGKIDSMLDQSIEEMTLGLNKFFERISNESTEYLAARNIFNNFDQTRQKMAERFMKANKTFITPSLFNSMTSFENGYNPKPADKAARRFFEAVLKEDKVDLSGTFEAGSFASRGMEGLVNAGYSSLISKSARNDSYQRSTEKRTQYHEAKSSTASSQADKFDETVPPLPQDTISPGKMSDSKVKSGNIKIAEAITSGNPNSILQGLVMSLHNNLLAPMYTDFFSENGMLNRFFGDDPNSEFNKLKEKLFGKEDGILTPLVDWTKYQFTGKGYVSRSGKVYEDKKGINAYAKELYGEGFGHSMHYLFGEDYAENETYQKFFHFLSPEGIKDTKEKIKAFKEHARLQGQYIATFRDLKDKVLNDEISSKEYIEKLGNIMTGPTGKSHATGLFKDLIENLDQDSASRVLEKVDIYNKELVEAGKLDSKKYGKLGEGKRRVLGYSQHNPRWADIVTGLRGDGSIATMDSSGCGIMALTYIANSMGIDLSPEEALRFAQTNGGITEGGVNSSAYTNSRNGLGGRRTSLSTALAALKRGYPAIVAGSGKGYGSDNPFGVGDHIMTLFGRRGNTVSGIDPDTGRGQLFNLDKLRGIKHAFTFNKRPALGFGKNEIEIDEHGTILSAPFLDNIIAQDPKSFSKNGNGIHYFDNIIDIFDHAKFVAIEDMLKNNNIKYSFPDPKLFAGAQKRIILDFDQNSQPNQPQPPSSPNPNNQLLDDIKVKITSIYDAIYFKKSGDGVFSDFYKMFNMSDKDSDIGNNIRRIRENTDQYYNYLDNFHMGLLGHDINWKAKGQTPIGAGNVLINISKGNNTVPFITINTPNNQPYPPIQPIDVTDLNFDNATLNVTNAYINLPSGQIASLLKTISTMAIDGEDDIKRFRRNEDGEFEEIKDEESIETDNILKSAYESNAEEYAKSMNKFKESVEELNKNFQETAEEAVGDPKDFKANFFKDLKKYNAKFKKAPGALIKGGLIGGAIGLMNMSGAGLLTSLLLPSSPVGGAIAGLGLTLLSRSEKFNNMLFGEKDEAGARKGGLITKSQVASFKKALPYAVGGATIGIVKNILTGALGISAGVPGIFGTALLGTNPIGAGIVGLGLGILKNSDIFKKKLFGDEDPDGKHSGGFFSKGLDKMTAIVKEISGYGKGALKGAGIGLGAGIVASNMGYLPAALSIGGPIGAAITGLGVGIASNSDRFKRYLFGDEYIDDEGKSTRKKNGLVHRVMNKFMDEVVYPIKNTFQDSVEEFVMWGKKNIVLPFKLAFGPLIDSFASFKDDLKTMIHDAFENLVDGITGILRGGLERILTPFNTAIRKVGQFAIKGVTKGAEFAALLPSLGLKTMAFATHRKRKRDDKEYRNAIYDDLEAKWARDEEKADGTLLFGKNSWVKRKWMHAKDLLGVGDFSDPDDALAAREEYGRIMSEHGRNALGWISAKAKYKADKAKFKADKVLKRNFRQAEDLMTKWKKADDHIEDRGWTDELIAERSKELRKLGLLKEGVSTEEDIKQLMYHRGDWQKRFGLYGTENLEIAEAKAKADENQKKTEAYQDGVTTRMDKILDYLSGKAHENMANQNTEKSEKRYGSLKNKYWYNKYELTAEDIDRIEKYTQGHIDFSESTVSKFTEYVKNMRERGNTNYYMDKDTYDDVFGDEVTSGAMRSYEEYMEDVAKEKAEKERLNAIDNSGFIESLFVRGYITEPVRDEMLNKYSNADISRRELIEKAAKLTFDRIEQSTNMGLDSNGNFAGYFHDTYKDDKTGFINVSEVINKLYKAEAPNDANYNNFSNRMYNLMETSETIHSEDWMEWLSNVISTSMIDAEEEIFKKEEEERLKAEEAAREAEESEEATEGTHKSSNVDDNRKWFEKFFVGKDGELNLLGKAGNRLKNSWLGKLVKGIGSLGSVISNSPMLQLGLLAGTFLFKEQIGDIATKIADGVKTVFKEWVPTAWNFVTETAIPFIWSNISTVAEYAIRAIPEILSGIKNGLSFLWNDVREWMGLKHTTDTYSANEVDVETGLTADGRRVAQWTDPETGETHYILNKKGEYQVLGDYQYISDNGTIENISRGTEFNLLKFGANAIKNPRNLAGGMKLVGGAVGIPSKILKHIPILGNAFRITEAGGSALFEGGKNLSKFIKENTVNGKTKNLIEFIKESIGNRVSKVEVDKLLRMDKETLAKSGRKLTKTSDDIIKAITKSSMNNDKAIELFDSVIKYGADSTEVTNILKSQGKMSKKNMKKVESIIDYATNIRDIAMKNGGKNIDELASYSTDFLNKGLKEAAEATAKQDAAKAAKEAVENAVGKEAKNVAKKTLKNAGGNAWDVAKTKAGNLIKKMINKIKSVGSSLRKFIDGTTVDKLLKKLSSMGDEFLAKASKSALGELVSKAASKLGKAIPVVNILFTVYDTIYGWCNAENLFGVPNGCEDGIMRTVSAVMNFILSLGVGPIFDIFLTVYSSVTGVNMKQEFALWLYETICTITGNSKAMDDLRESQNILKKELERYNADHIGGELTLQEYLELKEQEDSLGNIIKQTFGMKGAIDTSKYELKEEDKFKTSSGVTYLEKLAEYDAQQAEALALSAESLDIAAESLNNVTESMGYGSGAVGYGPAYSQADPKWAKFTLGKFPNGKTATMDLAGCGPTALANVASQMYGNITPVEVASMAVKKGYISDGGANARLFNEGASRLGLSSRRISPSDITRHLANGEKIIVAGKSVGYGNIFTPAGHIVTLESGKGDKVYVTDPQTGTTSIQSLSKMRSQMTDIWAFDSQIGSRGYISSPRRSYPLGYGNLGSGVYTFGANPNESPDSETHITYEEGYNFGEIVSRLVYGTYDKNDAYNYLKAVNYDGIHGTIDKYASDEEFDTKATWFKSLFPFMIDSDYEYITSSKEIYNKFMRYLYNVFGQSNSLYNFYRNSAAEMYNLGLSLNTSDEYSLLYNQLQEWWKNYSYKDQALYYWATDSFFHPKGGTSHDLTNDPEYLKIWNSSSYDKSAIHYMTELLFADYALNHTDSAYKLSRNDIDIIHRRHGFFNAHSIDVSENIDPTELDKEDIDIVKNHIVNSNKVALEKLKDPNDLASYNGLTAGTIYRMSDPNYGGDSSLMDSWLYRLLYSYLATGQKTDEDLSNYMVAITLAMRNIDYDNNDYSTTEGRPYGIVNKIPYYSINHDLWGGYNWKSLPFKSSGNEIAALASILTAYNVYNGSGTAITPAHMLTNWFIPSNYKWFNNLGIKDNFYTKIGLQSLKETFDGEGNPLKITQTSSSEEILNAMKSNKLVLMNNMGGNGELYDNLFGSGKFVIGTYADDNFFSVIDPTHPNIKSFPFQSITNFPRKGGIKAHIFETLSGGLNYTSPMTDINLPNVGSSTWDEINKESNSGLGLLSKIFKAIAAMGKNLLTGFINNLDGGDWEYESIFTQKMDSDNSGVVDENQLNKFDYLNEATTAGNVVDSSGVYLTANELRNEGAIKYPNAISSSDRFISTIFSMGSKDISSIFENGGYYTHNGITYRLSDTEWAMVQQRYKTDYTNSNRYIDTYEQYQRSDSDEPTRKTTDTTSNTMINNAMTYTSTASDSFLTRLIKGINQWSRGGSDRIISPTLGYGYGGENDEVTYDLSTVEGVLGRVGQIIGQRSYEAMAGIEYGELKGTTVLADTTTTTNTESTLSPNALTNVDPNTIVYGDQKSAYGLVNFAKSMKAAGCRYVWGGSCKKFTATYCESLRRSFGNDRAAAGKPTYYEDKFAKYANCYVSDCSGLIRGYTGKGGYTANKLYTSSQFKGKIDSVDLTIPGILIFRKSTENSNMVHVGIVVGDGVNVIHIAGEEANELSDVRLEPLGRSKWTHWGKNTSVLNYTPKPVEQSGSSSTRDTLISKPSRNVSVVQLGGENDIFGRNMTIDEYVKSLGYGPGNEVKYLLNTLGGRITQRVGLGIDPSTGIMTRHRGTDIAALYNSPIHSPVSGTVVENKSASYGSDYGNYVVVRDSSGKKHLIAHMNEASGYGVGSRINTGDIIGRVGSSGKSTGPHVHYEVRERDHIIDPLEYGKVTKHSLGLRNKTEYNILERKLDEAMTKHGSPIGGNDDILASLNTALSNDGSDNIVTVLQEIVSILTGWSSMDAESKNRILDVMEDATGNGNTVNVNNNNTTVNNATSNSSSSTNVNDSSSTRNIQHKKIESTGGRSLHDIIARKA